MRNRTVSIAILWMFLVADAAGPNAADMKQIDAASDAYQSGKYLKAAAMLRPLAIKPDGGLRDEMAYQVWTQVSAAIDDEPPARPAETSQLSDAEKRQLDSAGFQDALPAIVERARHTRVVILNENHSVSRDRAFGLAVARALQPLGYDVLAAETLKSDADGTRGANRMEALRVRGAPTLADGYYTRDPEFADFFRRAIAIGYRPAAYEATRYPKFKSVEAQIADRERRQASNLAKLIAANPNSKFLIYVGFSHVAEAAVKGDGPPQEWMAARLKRMTGIDPLTIDQTTVAPYGQTSAYRRISPRVRGRDVILAHSGRPFVFGQYAGVVDLQVVHPEARLTDGRPDWLYAMGRKPMPIPADLLPSRGVRLIQAFAASERDTPVPVDQVVVTAGQRPRALALPPDMAIRYAWQDDNGASSQPSGQN